MLPELVDKDSQREDVASSTKETQNEAPDNELWLHSVAEAEDCKAQVRKDASLGDECKCPHRLLHCDLGHRREIKVSIVRHDNPTEQYGHDS